MLPRKSLDVRPEGTGFRITLTPPPHWGVLVLALLFLGGILMRNFFPGISSHFFLLFLGASAIALLFFYCTREHIRVSEKGIDYHVSLAGFFIQGWSLGYQRITEIALKDHPPFLSLRVKGGEEQYPCVFSVPLAECGWLRECLAYFLLRNEEKGEVGIASAV
jgi:hypothetical protein